LLQFTIVPEIIVLRTVGSAAARQWTRREPDEVLQLLPRAPKSQGSERNRLPVAAKIAFVTAGATGGTPGSPTQTEARLK